MFSFAASMRMRPRASYQLWGFVQRPFFAISMSLAMVFDCTVIGPESFPSPSDACGSTKCPLRQIIERSPAKSKIDVRSNAKAAS